jgi:CDP-diacylglycerol---serine O-phosphatidyltransferase
MSGVQEGRNILRTNDSRRGGDASVEARKKRGLRSVPLRVLIPNLLTLFGLALGLTAIRFSYEDRVNLAVIAVVAAAGLDGLDGRVARLLRGTSRFGAELDSLADFVNFGVAPALILYGSLLHAARSLGWLAALVFATAMALRLARFNVALDDLSRPDWKKNFFTGVPAPAGAITGMLPLYLLKLGFGDVPGFVPFSVAYVLVIAFLMVSELPIYAGKTLGTSVTRDKVLFVFLAIVLFVTLVVNFTFVTLAVITLIYLLLIPLSVRRYRALDRAWNESRLSGEPATGHKT